MRAGPTRLQVLLGALAVAAALAAVLSASLLTSAARVEAGRLAAIEARFLDIVRTEGLSGAVEAIRALDRARIAGEPGFAVAVWQITPDGNRLRAASPGTAAALVDLPDRAHATIDDTRHRVAAPNIARLSADWNFPADDVALRVGLPVPVAEVTAARATVAFVWSVFAVAVTLGFVLHFLHHRHLKNSIDRMSSTLDRFAAGDTHVRLDDGQLVAEFGPLTQKINGMLGRTEDLIAGIRSMVAHAAHELKTPMQAILVDAATLDGAAAASIRSTVAEANARLENLMQLFRLETGSDVDFASRVDLSELVDRAIDDALDRIETEGRRLAWKVAPGITVAGSRVLLKMLADNLLDNAAKYAPAGSEVRVSVTAGDGTFRLSVANDGGFPEDVRDRAFDRYARAREDDAAPGAGLGLSLVSTISRRHGFASAIAPDPDRAEVIVTGPTLP